MNSSVRNAVLWLIILCLVVLAWAVFKTSKPAGKTPNFSELYRDVNEGKVESVTVNAALMKNFRIGERRRVQVRCED